MDTKYSNQTDAHFLEQIAQECAIRKWEVIQGMSEMEQRWGPKGESTAAYQQLNAELAALDHASSD